MLVIFVLSSFSIFGALTDDQRIIADEPAPADNRRFQTLGFSLGTTFADPLIIASIHGTFPIAQNVFFEIGCDFGFRSIYEDVTGYNSIHPFAHIGLFMPFRKRGGFFAGAGGGYKIALYEFDGASTNVNVFGFNVTAGFNFWDRINISYTLRTNFTSASNKLALGFVHRF